MSHFIPEYVDSRNINELKEQNTPSWGLSIKHFCIG